MPLSWVNNNSGTAAGSGALLRCALGAELTAATSIAITDSVHVVSGSATITTITTTSAVPVLLVLTPKAASTWSLGTGGNITGIASSVAATADRPFLLVWDGTTSWRVAGVVSLDYVKKSGDTMTGALVVPVGSVGATSISFTSDPNTGLWSPGADTLALSTGGTERLRVISSGQVGIAGTPVTHALEVTGTVSASTGLIERGRAARVGEWTAVPYSAGNFTAGGSMTWGVDSADVVTYRYAMFGKTMVITFYITQTDVAGTASNHLRLAIPNSHTAAATTLQTGYYYEDAGGVRTAGQILTTAATGYIQLYKVPITDWTLTAADNTAVYGQVVIEIQ